MVFSIVFQASTGKKLWKKNHGNSYGTCKFDTKNSAKKVRWMKNSTILQIWMSIVKGVQYNHMYGMGGMRACDICMLAH